MENVTQVTIYNLFMLPFLRSNKIYIALDLP